MTKLFTHYDKLKIPRDATDEQIIEAYRKILKEFDPNNLSQDKKEQAVHIRKIISQSYKILLNPEERTNHDNWINAQENTSNVLLPIDNGKQIDPTPQSFNCPYCNSHKWKMATLVFPPPEEPNATLALSIWGISVVLVVVFLGDKISLSLTILIGGALFFLIEELTKDYFKKENLEYNRKMYIYENTKVCMRCGELWDDIDVIND